MEDENNNKSDDSYLDLSDCFDKEEPKIEEPIKEPVTEEPVEVKEEPIEVKKEYKPLPNNNVVSNMNYKTKKRKGGGIIIALVFISLLSLGTSAYVVYDNQILKRQLDNPELIYSGDWDCFTERCTDYMTINEWSKDNCNDALTECNINYEGQNLILPFEQINLPPQHELLCKGYVCSTEIPIRRYSDE